MGQSVVRDISHEGCGREYDITRGGAECDIILETTPRMRYIPYYTKIHAVIGLLHGVWVTIPCNQGVTALFTFCNLLGGQETTRKDNKQGINTIDECLGHVVLSRDNGIKKICKQIYKVN